MMLVSFEEHQFGWAQDMVKQGDLQAARDGKGVQLRHGKTNEQAEQIRQLAGSDYAFSNRLLSNSEVRGTYYAFALFFYGFLALIALITVLNIVNSISMSVSARIKQYGAMRAVGMSGQQLLRMVAAETLTYVCSGIAVGCAAGIPLNRFTFENLVTPRWYPPWAALGVICESKLPLAPVCVPVRGAETHACSILYCPRAPHPP